MESERDDDGRKRGCVTTSRGVLVVERGGRRAESEVEGLTRPADPDGSSRPASNRSST